MRPQSLVASPSAIGSTPLASGSSVPPWPTLVLDSPLSRSSRLIALTACVDPSPTGLSKMIQPLSDIARALVTSRRVPNPDYGAGPDRLARGINPSREIRYVGV